MNNKIMRRKQHLKKKTSTAEHQKPTETMADKKAQQIEKSRPSREMLVKLIFFKSKSNNNTQTPPPRKQCNFFSRKFNKKIREIRHEQAGRNVKRGEALGGGKQEELS